MLTYIFVVGMFLLIPVLFLFIALLFRRVVPTNMVHIVQSAKSTISYGRDKDDGNTYYAWPSWIPKIGISVIEFPESIFKVTLNSLETRPDFINEILYDTKNRDGDVPIIPPEIRRISFEL